MSLLAILFLSINFIFQFNVDSFDSDSLFRRGLKPNSSQNILIEDDYYAMSRRAVDIFIAQLESVLESKEQAVVMLPTGGTYFNEGGFYSILRAEHRDSIDWDRVIFFNLDEYVDIAPKDENSYNHQLRANILEPLAVKVQNIHLFNGCCEDLNREIAKRESLIEEFGGIDICLLGVGVNGHIGFNEPGSAVNSKTRVVDLSRETIVQNSGYFRDRVMSDSAITVGISTILSSKVIMLLASGESKSQAVNDTLRDVNPLLNPASFLNRAENSDIFYIFDIDAVSGFERSELENMGIGEI